MITIPSLFACLFLAGPTDPPRPIEFARYVDPATLLMPAPAVDARLLAAMLPFGPCMNTALAARKAERNAARADHLYEVANCVQEGGSVWGCLVAGQAEWLEAREFVDDVFAERMQLCQTFGSAAYDPPLDPAQFCASITNPLLPFVPGRKLVYRAVTPEGIEKTRVKLRPETIEIAGRV